MAPRRWLALACVLVALPALGKAPVLDEESYLWLATHLDPLRPYDWARDWPPYDASGFVYAHPPGHLWWTWLCAQSGLPLPALRLLAGLPWLLLFGYAAGLWFERSTRHPHLAGLAWLACPIVALGLQDTLMIDLPAAALATAALAFYREGLAHEERKLKAGIAFTWNPWHLAAGVALGLGADVKYPVLLVVGVLVAHMARYGWRPLVLVVAGGLFLADELLLAVLYGRVHLWEVWERREEIAHGPAAGRALGTVARAALLPLPLALVRADPRVLIGAGAAVLMFALVPVPLELPARIALLAFVAVGALGLARAATAAVASGTRRRHGDRGDGLLLGGAVAVYAVGVAFGHNYASARYLLPAAAPLAALVVRTAEGVAGGKLLARIGVGLGAALTAAVVVADYRYAAAGVEVALAAQAAAAEEAPDAPPGRFAGEWSFRYTMEGAGWARLKDGETPPAGSLVVVVDNASAGVVPASLDPRRRVTSRDRFPLRVNDLDAGASMYAETLGALPLGWASTPLEGATLSIAAGSR